MSTVAAVAIKVYKFAVATVYCAVINAEATYASDNACAAETVAIFKFAYVVAAAAAMA